MWSTLIKYGLVASSEGVCLIVRVRSILLSNITKAIGNVLDQQKLN